MKLTAFFLALVLALVMGLFQLGGFEADESSSRVPERPSHIRPSPDLPGEDGETPWMDPGEEADHSSAPFSYQDGAYEIETAEDLALLGELIAGEKELIPGERAQFASYRLKNDLDLSAHCTGEGGWNPIGSYVWGGVPMEKQTLAFSGRFDGNGKIIRGLSISRPGESGEQMFQGLFGYSCGAEIVNLIIEDCDVEGGTFTGGLAGGSWNYGEGLTVENCRVSGRVLGRGAHIGGVVGSADMVTYSGFSGTVRAEEAQCVGGVAGGANGVMRCRADGQVYGHNMVGGAAGQCYRVLDSYAVGEVSGYQEVGGVVGIGAQVAGCYAGARVTGYEAAGGLVGRISTTYNVEETPIEGVMVSCCMAGPAVVRAPKSEETFNWLNGRMAGFVGDNVYAESIFARRDAAIEGRRAADSTDRWLQEGYTIQEISELIYYYDGEDLPPEGLSIQAVWEKMLLGENEKWDDIWQPMQMGMLPQLLWETGPAFPIPKAAS